MANRAIYLGVNVLFFLQLGPELKLVSADVFGLPVQLGHEFDRSKMRFRVAMAIDTPSHRLIFVLVDDFHLVDATVASDAGNASSDVGRVIEVDVVGKAVNANPVDRLAGSPAFMDGLEPPRFVAVCMDSRIGRGTVRGHRTVAVDTSLSGRNGRVSRLVNRIMAVTAVHLQLAGMDRMTEGDRLDWLISGVQCDRARGS